MKKRTPFFLLIVLVGIILLLVVAIGFSGKAITDAFRTGKNTAGQASAPIRGEIPASETGTTTYVYGSKLIAKKTAIGITYDFQDSLGSNTITTNQAGMLQSRFSSYPYGKTITKESMSGGQQKYTFTGKEDDGKLMYYGARYLNPRIGRFIGTDQSLSSYSLFEYAAGNPLILVDPTGNAVEKASLVFEYIPLPYSRELLPGTRAPILQYDPSHVNAGRWISYQVQEVMRQKSAFEILKMDNLHFTYDPTLPNSVYRGAGNIGLRSYLDVFHEVAHSFQSLETQPRWMNEYQAEVYSSQMKESLGMPLQTSEKFSRFGPGAFRCYYYCFSNWPAQYKEEIAQKWQVIRPLGPAFLLRTFQTANAVKNTATLGTLGTVAGIYAGATVLSMITPTTAHAPTTLDEGTAGSGTNWEVSPWIGKTNEGKDTYEFPTTEVTAERPKK